MKPNEKQISLERSRYYQAVNQACTGATDAELGYELLTRVQGKDDSEITEKDLINARLYVNQCRNPDRRQSFKLVELLVIEAFTGNPAVLRFHAESLGFAAPKQMCPHERFKQLTLQMHRLEMELESVMSERERLESLVESQEPAKVLIDHPGVFSGEAA